MRIQFCVLAMIIFGCAIMGRSVQRQVINDTGATITQIYIKDSGTNNWGDPLNRTKRTTKESATCKKCTRDGCYDVPCERTEYVKDANGEFVYDVQNLSYGSSFPYKFFVSSGQSSQRKVVDVKLVTSEGLVYVKKNVDLMNIEMVVITENDIMESDNWNSL